MSEFQQQANEKERLRLHARDYTKTLTLVQDEFYGTDNMDKTSNAYKMCREIIKSTSFMIYDVEAQGKIDGIKIQYEIQELEKRLRMLTGGV